MSTNSHQIAPLSPYNTCISALSPAHQHHHYRISNIDSDLHYQLHLCIFIHTNQHFQSRSASSIALLYHCYLHIRSSIQICIIDCTLCVIVTCALALLFAVCIINCTSASSHQYYHALLLALAHPHYQLHFCIIPLMHLLHASHIRIIT